MLAAPEHVSDVNFIPLMKPRYAVQSGVFSTYKNAMQYQTTLELNGMETQIMDDLKEDKSICRAILDSFSSADEVLQFLIHAKEKHGVPLYIAQINDKNHALGIVAL